MKQVRLMACVFALVLMATACFADSQSWEQLITSQNSNDGGFAGVTFTANFKATSGGTFTLDFQVTDTSNANVTLNEFTISLLGGGSNSSINVIGPSTLPNSTWTELDNAKINNNGTVGCSLGNGFGGWLCASGTTPLTLLPNGSFDFLFAGTYTGSMTTPFDLMANGLVGTNKYAVSDNMVAPEPSSMLFLGLGLSGAAFLRRLKKPKAQ